MEKMIDEALEYLTDFDLYSPYQEAIDKVSAYIKQMQADYETRLKADMVAMLTDLLKDIEGMDSREGECIYATPWCIDRDIVIDIIQERIKEWEKLSSEKQ